MMIYRESSKTIQKLLDLITDFTKITGNEIDIKKCVAFIYTNSNWKEKLRKLSHLQLHQNEQKS